MSKLLVLSLTLIAIPVRPDRAPIPEPPTASLFDQLQGEWQMTSGIIGGQREPAERVNGTSLTVKGKTMFIREAKRGKDEPASFTIDLARVPMEIDIMPEGLGNERRIQGIFKIEGNLLTLCFADGGQRPGAFVSTPDARVVLVEFNRIRK